MAAYIAGCSHRHEHPPGVARVVSADDPRYVDQARVVIVLVGVALAVLLQRLGLASYGVVLATSPGP